MMRTLLNPNAAEHLRKLCGMFGSDHDGERAAAALKADQFVRRLGFQWRDVLAVPPEWQFMVKVCRDHAYQLSDRELEFVLNMSRARKQPTDKQLSWLEGIYSRLTAEVAA